MASDLIDRRASRLGRAPGAALRAALPAALVLSLAAVSPAWAWHLPWHPHWPHRAHRAAAAPTGPTLMVQLDGGTASRTALPQSWDRNTLLVDLTHLGGSGSATLTPAATTGWPARLAFRVQPGSFASLTVQGAQRVQFTLPAQGKPMDLQLDPGVYVVRTPSVTLQWNAADGLPR
ncbi:MAG TPA: hypothetical protein VKT19_00670 [Steroidobacteraceae bacterium]|nr:hypothetical protein [Steroidobacteraceae bacterium]